MIEKDIKISEMLGYSKEMWEKHKESWLPMTPEEGKTHILWMIEEIGEVIQIIKKKGENEIMSNSQVRERFIEESCDVIMYFSDVLNRFEITPEEFSKAYMKKVEKNLKRDFVGERKEFLTKK